MVSALGFVVLSFICIMFYLSMQLHAAVKALDELLTTVKLLSESRKTLAELNRL